MRTNNFNGGTTSSPYVANLRDFNGFNPNGTNDQTGVIQTAMNQLHVAGGGEVVAPLGIYILDGPLQTNINGVNPNCQIYAPFSQAGDNMKRIKIEGEAPPQWASEVISGASRNLRGVIFKSTILGSGIAPCILGTPWYNSPTGPFNYTYIDIENIVFQYRTKTGTTEIQNTMSGILFDKLVSSTLKEVCIQSESTPSTLLSPAGTGNYGIKMPAINNKAIVRMDGTVKMEGFETGLQISEHFVGNDVLINACISGLELTAMYHLSSIGHCKLEGNKNNIVVNGAINKGAHANTGVFLKISAFDTEHYTGPEFYSFAKDIYFATETNNRININDCHVVKSGIGPANEFVVDAGVNYKIHNGHGQNVNTAT